MAQVSVGLNVTSRWRPRLEDRLQAGGAGTPRKGLLLLSEWTRPRAAGPCLEAPPLRGRYWHLSILRLAVSESTGQRTQGPGPGEASLLWQSLGPFLAPGSFLLGFFPEPSLPEATGLSPCNNTELILLCKQVAPAQEAMQQTHWVLSAASSCLFGSQLPLSTPSHRPRGPQLFGSLHDSVNKLLSSLC